MGNDIWIVLQWWGTLFLVGAVAFPLTKRLFTGKADSGFHEIGQSARYSIRIDNIRGWWDGGYLFSKAVGMAVVTWIVYVMGTLHVMPFSVWSIVVAMMVLFGVGISLQYHVSRLRHNSRINFQFSIFNFQSIFNSPKIKQWIRIVLEELFFLGALFLWSWVKGHEPSIHGLEKFMDYGFMKSILNAQYFPPADMWYAGLSINYYYFGHMVVAVLTKLSGLDLSYTFNLMLASIFAFTFTMSFSIGKQLLRIRGIGGIRAIGGGLLTAFLVTLAGNMQTLYAFTKGYTGDAVRPFWTLLWNVSEFWQKLPEGLNRYWYANATRFIPFTIHEFPSYSFVVSDVHGHVLSLPFTLLAIALLVELSAISYQQSAKLEAGSWKLKAVFYGFLVGVLLMTNALDGPIYLGLFTIILGVQSSKSKVKSLEWWKEKGIAFIGVAIVAVVTSLPFLFHFKSFVTGIALNCPPAFLADRTFGPLLFEAVEKCQHSPLWMMWLLWGFFVYCGVWLISTKLKIKTLNFKLLKQTKSFFEFSQVGKLLVIFFVFSLALIIFPEFFYFKDIYPAHFRSNTMFKLGYQAFVLFSIVSGYTIINIIFHLRDTHNQNAKCQMPPARIATQSVAGGNAKWVRFIFLIFLIPQLFLVSIFPIFSVRSYFDSLRNYKGLNGLAWLEEQYPDDYEGIKWLNIQMPNAKCQMLNENPCVIIEADGDSYTDHARFSAFTGLPTIIGWPVHEWLWRGSYDVVSPRRDVVRKIYESEDIDETKDLLKEYDVSYIIVGTLERQKFQNINEDKLQLLGQIVFQQGETTIYRVIN